MKAIMFALILALSVAGCASSVSRNGRVYETYGLLDRDAERTECVNYKISYGNIFWSIVFIETIVVPVWLIGFNLYEPLDTSRCAFEDAIRK